MRIALANCHRQIVGGAESYIKGVVPELESAGVELALLTEIEPAPDRERIELSAGAPAWSVSEIGEQAAVDAMRAWRPDAVYAHLVESPRSKRACSTSPRQSCSRTGTTACASAARRPSGSPTCARARAASDGNASRSSIRVDAAALVQSQCGATISSRAPATRCCRTTRQS